MSDECRCVNSLSDWKNAIEDIRDEIKRWGNIRWNKEKKDLLTNAGFNLMGISNFCKGIKKEGVKEVEENLNRACENIEKGDLDKADKDLRHTKLIMSGLIRSCSID